MHKLLHPSQTRCLSLSAVFDRIFEQSNALVLYFQEKWLDQKLVTAENIHADLHDPSIEMCFGFFKWILPKFTKTEQYFQSSKVVITDVHDVMVTLYTDLLNCYMKRSYDNSTALSKINSTEESQFLPKYQMDLGVHVMEKLKNIDVAARQDLVDYFLSRCQKFLIQACTEIKDRYDFDNIVLERLRIFKLEFAMSDAERSRMPTLSTLLSKLHRVVSAENYQRIDDEWRQLPSFKFDEDLQTLETDTFWGKTFRNDSNEDLFNNLALRSVLNVLSLPHSNADSERAFSKINLVKTKTRNKLIVPIIKGILLSNQHKKKSGGTYNSLESKKFYDKFEYGP